jgi:hypothetical protein
MKRIALLSAAAVLLGSLTVWADVQSGPDLDEKLPPLKAFVVTGDEAEKTLDVAAERKDKPTIYILIQAEHWARPLGRYLKTLDTEIAKKGDDVHIVAAWLTADEDKTKEYLPIMQNAVQLKDTTVVIYPDVNGPDGWGINTTAHMTTVVVHKGKPTATFGHVSINETVAREILKELEDPKK